MLWRRQSAATISIAIVSRLYNLHDFSYDAEIDMRKGCIPYRVIWMSISWNFHLYRMLCIVYLPVRPLAAITVATCDIQLAAPVYWMLLLVFWLRQSTVMVNSLYRILPHLSFFLHFFLKVRMPSVLWRCWLGGRKGIRPVKNWAVGCWRGYLSGARCRLAYGPVDFTATHCLLLQ